MGLKDNGLQGGEEQEGEENMEDIYKEITKAMRKLQYPPRRRVRSKRKSGR